MNAEDQQKMAKVLGEVSAMMLNDTPAAAVLVVTVCPYVEGETLKIMEAGSLGFPEEMPDTLRLQFLPRIENAVRTLFQRAELKGMAPGTAVIQ